jgi:hypothetical protein
MILSIIKSKIFFVLTSLLISIILIEIILTYFSSYNYTRNTGYEKHLNTIITRKKSTYLKVFHPDLSYEFFNFYDINNIKNRDQLNTNSKKNQLAFFGDSFVEARLVEEIFSFTKILDNLTKNYNVVNYGLDSFGVEQSFQRYLDYSQNKDIDILKLTHNDKKITFKNDGHLNEYGNLIVAIQITDYLINKKYLEKSDYLYKKFFLIQKSIDTLYDKHK